MKRKKRYLQKRPPMEYTIYSSDATTEAMEEELRFMKEEDGQEDATEDQAWARVHESINEDWERLIEEAKHSYSTIQNGQDVTGWYIGADLGLWDGRRKAHKTVKTLSDALYAVVEGMDTVVIKESNRGKVTVTGYHHDGTNYYEIKRIKNGRELNGRIRQMLGWI